MSNRRARKAGPRKRPKQRHSKQKRPDAKQEGQEREQSARRVHLNALQTMGVKLMQAREIVTTKNRHIAQVQAVHSRRAQADAQRIRELEAENAELAAQLMNALNRAEEAENEALGRQLGLPQGKLSFKVGDDGHYFYEVEGEDDQGPADGTSLAAAPPALDEGGAEEA